MYVRPRPLARNDVLESFVAASEEQTLWLTRHARQAHAARSAHVMVVTQQHSHDVAAYYALAMASVAQQHLPHRAAQGVGLHPQPFALLARLAVDRPHERQGLGRALFKDALVRTLELSQEIGCRGLLVHAEGDDAREFYLHALPGLQPSPTDPLHLIALTKDMRRTLGL